MRTLAKMKGVCYRIFHVKMFTTFPVVSTGTTLLSLQTTRDASRVWTDMSSPNLNTLFTLEDLVTNLSGSPAPFDD